MVLACLVSWCKKSGYRHQKRREKHSIVHFLFSIGKYLLQIESSKFFQLPMLLK